MKRLLPFETLNAASTILNEVCRENQLLENSRMEDFLVDAINGDINITVVLPDDFHVARKNLENYRDTPFRPRFPKGSIHCFISRSTAFHISLNQSAVLDTVFTISNDGAEDIYHSVKPCIAISAADLRISEDQLMRYIKKLYFSKNEPIHNKAIGTSTAQVKSAANDAKPESDVDVWDKSSSAILAGATEASAEPEPSKKAPLGFSDSAASDGATKANEGQGKVIIKKLKKSALVKKYERQWPTAYEDIADNSRNELHTAQLGGGFYDEDKAIQWAIERGKFNEINRAEAQKSSIHDCPVSVKNRLI